MGTWRWLASHSVFGMSTHSYTTSPRAFDYRYFFCFQCYSRSLLLLFFCLSSSSSFVSFSRSLNFILVYVHIFSFNKWSARSSSHSDTPPPSGSFYLTIFSTCHLPHHGGEACTRQITCKHDPNLTKYISKMLIFQYPNGITAEESPRSGNSQRCW